MPLEPRGASYYTDIVKSSAEASAAIGGAVARGGNSAPRRPSGALASVIRNNIFAQIQFREEDNMPGPPGPTGSAGPQGLIGPTGPAGPAGSGGGDGSFSALFSDSVWGGNPPTTTEEAINRIATMLWLYGTRQLSTNGIPAIASNATFITISNAGGNDAFIAKYDTCGIPLWARRIGGISNEQGNGIAVDSTGNAYTIGYSTGTGTVFAADGSTTAFTLSNAGGNDAFIVKYDTCGTPLWARRIGGTLNDNGNSIAVDSTGNVYTTGSYTSAVISLYAADGNTVAFSLSNIGTTSNDVFIAKHDTCGTPLWIAGIGGISNDIGYGIAADSAGNSYITGHTNVTATIRSAGL